MRNIVLFICSYFFTTTITVAQPIDTPYVYPVRPGMEEWKILKSGKEKADACKIPDSILPLLTTNALAKTCLNYPLLIEVFYADNIQKGIDAVILSFNGLTELLERKEAGVELLKIYKNKIPDDLNEDMSLHQKGLFTFEFTYLELLLSRSQILNNLPDRDRILLLKEAVAKSEGKKKQFDVFGEFGLTSSALLIAKILSAENKLGETLKTVSEEDIDIFLATGMYTNPLLVEAIFSTGKLFLQ